MRSITKNKKKRLRPLLLWLVVLLVVAAGIVFYSQRGNEYTPEAVSDSTSDDTTPVNTEPPTPDQIDTGTEIKEAELEEEQEDTQTGYIDVEIQPPVVADGTIKIRTTLKTVTNIGSCTLSLSRSGQTTRTFTAGVQALSSYSTCKGFTVSTAGLTSGTWTVQIIYRNATVEGSAETKVEIP